MAVLDGDTAHGDEVGRRDAGELGPIAAEVSLIVVAALERDPGPARGPALCECERALKSAYDRVALGRHPDILGEDLDEAPPAQPDESRDLADFDTGPVQLGHGDGNRRAMASAAG